MSPRIGHFFPWLRLLNVIKLADDVVVGLGIWLRSLSRSSSQEEGVRRGGGRRGENIPTPTRRYDASVCIIAHKTTKLISV